jgi:hypothetical protein
MNNATAEPIELLLQLSATDLIWLGETADGKRDVDLVLVRDKHGEARLKEKPGEGDEKVRDIKIRTEPSKFGPGKEREKIAEVVCRSKEGGEVRLMSEDDYDAVFWSESAIGKFVWPYYHSHRLWDKQIQDVKDKFDGDSTAVAVAHQAPSKSSTKTLSPVESLLVGRLSTLKAAPELEFVSAIKYLQEVLDRKAAQGRP